MEALITRKSLVGMLLLSILALGALRAGAEPAYQPSWAAQISTPVEERAYGTAGDGAGNVLVGGSTAGDLEGANLGIWDAFVRKYGPAGGVVWTVQLGTSAVDAAYGLAADEGGNVFLTGATGGGLGGASAGGNDAFVCKYDAYGNEEWTRQLGTDSDDQGRGVALDGMGNILVCGYTYGDLGGDNAGAADVFVSKFDPCGAVVWTRQFGTSSSDYGRGIAVDGTGCVVVSGETWGALAGPRAGFSDAFVSKFDPCGGLLWERQFGTSTVDYCSAVGVDDDGNVLVTGPTAGTLGAANAGGTDAFVYKFDPCGGLVWGDQLGSTLLDQSTGVSADPMGNVLVGGYTAGDLGGANEGSNDLFLCKYDPCGTVLWMWQGGTDEADYGMAVSAEGPMDVLMCGYTAGDLAGANAGSHDAFVARLTAPCGYVLTGDLDDDCRVDLMDVSVLAGQVDVNNPLDLGELAEITANWLMVCYPGVVDPECVPK